MTARWPLGPGSTPRSGRDDGCGFACDECAQRAYELRMITLGSMLAASLALVMAGCVSIPETTLVPSDAVAQQGRDLLWMEESVAAPNLLETTRPQFAANAEHQSQARSAFAALAAHFPECPAPSRLGYATWARSDQMLVLFELRREPDCPTTPLVSLDGAGNALVVVTPDQPRAFE